jgi:hypothetical protein
MFNTVYNYNSKEKDGFKVQDYTSIYFGGLKDLIENNPEYFEFVDVADNEKMENISYQRYGNENYADLILACNNENFLWSMPYGENILLEQLDSVMHMINVELNITPDSEGIDLDYKFLETRLYNKIDKENSQKRRFRVPKIEYLTNVINLINNYKKDNEDTQWLLGVYE